MPGQDDTTVKYKRKYATAEEEGWNPSKQLGCSSQALKSTTRRSLNLKNKENSQSNLTLNSPLSLSLTLSHSLSPSLTLSLSKSNPTPTIEALSGYQKKNRTDVPGNSRKKHLGVTNHARCVPENFFSERALAPKKRGGVA